MGKMSRNKGKDFERQVANWLKGYGYTDAMRSAQHSGKAGDAADVVGLPGIHIECKAVETCNIWAWLDQADRDSAGTGNIPVVIWKRNRMPWLVVMRLESFLDFRVFRGFGIPDVGFHIYEGRQSRLYDWLDEVKEFMPAGVEPAVKFTHLVHGPIVAMYAESFIRLYHEEGD